MGIETKLIIIFAVVLILPAIVVSLIQNAREKKKGCPGKCEGCEHYGYDGSCGLGIKPKGFVAVYHKDKNKYE